VSNRRSPSDIERRAARVQAVGGLARFSLAFPLLLGSLLLVRALERSCIDGAEAAGERTSVPAGAEGRRGAQHGPEDESAAPAAGLAGLESEGGLSAIAAGASRSHLGLEIDPRQGAAVGAACMTDAAAARPPPDGDLLSKDRAPSPQARRAVLTLRAPRAPPSA
jgi:hypothetical protein